MRNRSIFLGIVLLLIGQLSLKAQSRTGKLVSFKFQKESLSNVLKKIEKASGAKILFVYDDVKPYTVSAIITNSSAADAVRQVIAGYPLALSVQNEFISVRKKEAAPNPSPRGDKGHRAVSGIVTDEKKEPLVGVAVLVNGTSIATSTNEAGKFDISLPDGNSVLRLSYVGMKTKLVNANGGFLDVMLEKEVKLLDDLIVTGYQTISKERATGSFVKITSEDLKFKRFSSLENLLKGQVPGLTDGILRGTSTMYGDTSPLYVIDGFPVEDQTMGSSGLVSNVAPKINLDDIDNITILKDAAASSIYGARAANGVIVITTKKRTNSSKAEVHFSSVATWSPYHYYTGNLLNSADLIDLEKEWASTNTNLAGSDAANYAATTLNYPAYQNAGIRSILNYYAGNIPADQMNSTLENLASQGYRYYKQIEKYAKTDPLYQQYNLSVTKTNDVNTFKASITYKKNQYEDKYTKDQSLGVNFSNTTQITKWLNLDLGTFINLSGQDQQTFSVTSPGYSICPYSSLVNDDGTKYTASSDLLYEASNVNTINSYGLYDLSITPLDEISKNIGKTNGVDLRTYARLNFNILPVLKYAASAQYERGISNYKQIMEKDSYSVRSTVDQFATIGSDNTVSYNIPYGDILNQRDQNRLSYNIRQQLDYDQTFAGKHNVTAIAGTETRENKISMHRQTQYGYDDQLLTYTTVNEANLVSGVTGAFGSAYLSSLSGYYESLNRYVSFYGNAAYTYDGKYSATGSLRWDRSNLWGTSSKYQSKPIWSSGLAWIVTHENFAEKIDWLNFLKLRVSYGIGGNVSPDYSPYTVAYYSQNTNVGGNYGYVRVRPNKNLSWEKTTTTNLGMDFTAFNNRLRGTLEYYNRQGSRLLASTMGVPTEGYGYSTYATNNGEMRNRGIDISLNGDVVSTPDFKWTAMLTFNHNQNKVTYVNVKAPVYYLQLDYSSAYPIIGDSYGAIYGYKWAGLSSEGLPQVYDETGTATTEQPTTLEAIKNFGSSTPTYSGSFGSTFSYKRFDFSFQMTYRGGYKIRSTNIPFLNYSYVSGVGYVSNFSNLSASMANRWKQAGDEEKTNIPRATFIEAGYPLTTLYSVYQYADINILKADNLVLNDVSFSYTLPDKIASRFACRGLRVQANVENPHMWAKDKQAKYQLGGYTSPNYVVAVNANF